MKRYSCEMNDGEYLCSFHQLKDAAIYGSNIKKYLKETNKGYEETLGFASICNAIGPYGNKYTYYYCF